MKRYLFYSKLSCVCQEVPQEDPGEPARGAGAAQHSQQLSTHRGRASSEGGIQIHGMRARDRQTHTKFLIINY